jgi:hypothetical protein
LIVFLLPIVKGRVSWFPTVCAVSVGINQEVFLDIRIAVYN